MATIRNTIALQNRMTPVLRSVVKALDSTIDAMQRTGNASDAAFSTARADVAAATAAIDMMNNELAETPAQQQAVTNGFTVMKGIIADIGASIVRHIVMGLKNAVTNGIKLASDLLEVQNVIDKTFGDSAGVMDAWSKTALNAYGLSELSAKKYASTLGAMLKAADVADDKLTVMATSLTGLAGDIASFHNLKPEEAFVKLQAAMAGEIEPLRRLGYNMSVANLEAYALAKGIKTQYQNMDEAARASLRYNYLMEKTVDLQGDFADTSDNFANQQKLMTENWNELTAMMAEYVLPALTQIIMAANTLISALKPYAPILTSISVALGIAAVALGVYTAAQWAMNTAMWANPVTWIIAGIIALVVVIAGLIGWIIKLYKENVAFRVGILGVWDDVLTYFDKVPVFFTRVGNGIADVFGFIKTSVINEMQEMVNQSIFIINGFIKMLNKIPGVGLEVIGEATFGATQAADAEAKKQSRDSNLANMVAQADAKAVARDHMINQYALKQSGLEAEQKRLQEEQLRKLADMEKAASDGVEISGGTLDKVKGDISISEEDIKLLKDVAAVEFINQYTTLRPELKVEIAEVKETADIDAVITYIEDMVETAYESSLEGVG